MAKRETINCQIFPYISEKQPSHSLIMDCLMDDFKDNCRSKTFKSFVSFCKKRHTKEICTQIEMQTREQSEDKLWFLLRFARVTASVFHEFSVCKTLEGSLVERVMGGGRLRTNQVDEKRNSTGKRSFQHSQKIFS
jgi:hypothetical protein